MSTDRGSTSVVRPNVGGTLTQILVDRQDGNSVLAIRDTMIRRSSDGGQTWNENVGYTGLNEFVRVSANEIVIAAASGIYTSPDNGATLIKQYDGSFTSVSVDPASPGTVLAASSDGAILSPSAVRPAPGTRLDPRRFCRSAPQTRSSQAVAEHPRASSSQTRRASSAPRTMPSRGPKRTSGPVASNPTDKLASTPGANARVYAYIAGLADGLFSTSLDSGWQRQNVRAAANSVGQIGLWAIRHRGEARQPADDLRRHVGSRRVPLERWRQHVGHSRAPDSIISRHAPSRSTQSIRTSCMRPWSRRAAPRLRASLYRSTDGGATRSQRSTNFRDIFALRLIVDPAHRDRLFAAGYQGFFPPGRGGLYRSVDGGASPGRNPSPESMCATSPSIPPTPTGVYAATALGLQVSNDGGVTFNPNNAFVSIAGSYAAAVAIDPVTPTTLYAANLDPDAGATNHTDNSSYILRSVDRGQSWVPLRAINDAPKWFVGDLPPRSAATEPHLRDHRRAGRRCI